VRIKELPYTCCKSNRPFIGDPQQSERYALPLGTVIVRGWINGKEADREEERERKRERER